MKGIAFAVEAVLIDRPIDHLRFKLQALTLEADR